MENISHFTTHQSKQHNDASRPKYKNMLSRKAKPNYILLQTTDTWALTAKNITQTLQSCTSKQFKLQIKNALSNLGLGLGKPRPRPRPTYFSPIDLLKTFSK